MQKIRKNNYTRFLGSLIKKGNKTAARNILTETLLKLTKKRSAQLATKQKERLDTKIKLSKSQKIQVEKQSRSDVNLVLTRRKQLKKGSKKQQLKQLKKNKKATLGGYSLFNVAFDKLDNGVEIKKVPWGKKKKKIINLIPFPVKARRQHFLKVKWILAGAKEDKKQTNFSDKILNEMWNILYDPKKSVSLAKRKEIRKQVLENRSNSHFRW